MDYILTIHIYIYMDCKSYGKRSKYATCVVQIIYCLLHKDKILNKQNNNEKQNQKESLPQNSPPIHINCFLFQGFAEFSLLDCLHCELRSELSQSRIKMRVFVLWSALWNKIPISLRLTVFYEWEKRESLGLYYAGIDLNFSSIKSSNVQRSNEIYFSYFLHSVPVFPIHCL